MANQLSRDWRYEIDCPVHGRERGIVTTFPGQRPREVLLTPPACGACADTVGINGPTPRVISIEAMRAG